MPAVLRNIEWQKDRWVTANTQNQVKCCFRHVSEMHCVAPSKNDGGSYHFNIYLILYLIYSFIEIYVISFEKRGSNHFWTDFAKEHVFQVQLWGWANDRKQNERVYMLSINQPVKWHFYTHFSQLTHKHKPNVLLFNQASIARAFLQCHQTR